MLWAVGPLALLVNLPVLRGVAEAGRIVEHAGVVAAGQAATVAVAATTAAVLAVPGVAPAGDGRQRRAPHARQCLCAIPPSRRAQPTPPSHARSGTTKAATGPQVRDASFTTTKSVRKSHTHRPVAARAFAVHQSPRLSRRLSIPRIPPTAPPVVAVAVTRRVSLGSAANFAVLAGSTITNTGSTTITGSVGLSPGHGSDRVPGGLLDVVVHTDNAVAADAKTDLADAYDDAAARPTTDTIPVELGGTTQTPGVYDSAAGTFGITGTVTLDAKGDPDAVFIFKSASTLITASGSRVKLVNGAQAANVFWQVGSSATLGTYSVLRGNVLALASITVTTGATVDGRMLARTGAVTLDSDTITRTPGGR